jgi:hypothetical protein
VLSLLSVPVEGSVQSEAAAITPPGPIAPPGHEIEALADAPALSSEDVATTTTAAAVQTPVCFVTGIVTCSPSATPPPWVPPSLLRYVDGDLMRTAAAHNCPPHPAATCSVCHKQWDAPINPHQYSSPSAATTSTFLPLLPCGHWIHYRCLVWLATQYHARKDTCYECGIQLFQWEGITALTLATRTGLNMEDGYRGGLLKMSDRAEYEHECAKIQSLIHAQFFAHLFKESRHADGSPDLVQCFYDVLDTLQRMSKPQARWLQYNTQTGYLLYGMLVTIKMRKYLLEGHAKIEGTEGWKEFEVGRKTMQDKILAEVHAT